MISAVQSSGKIGNHQWKSPFMWSASSISFSFVRELTRPTYERGRRVETLARTNVRRSRGGSSASCAGWTWILLADDGAASARRYARLVSRRRALDVLLVAFVFVATTGMLGAERDWAGEAARTRDALGVGLAAATAVPLLLRRRSPVAAFALSALPSALIAALGYPPGPPLGPTIALFFVAKQPSETQRGRQLAAVVVVAMYVLHVGASWIGRSEAPLVPVLLGALVWGGAWVLGDRVRQRQERARERGARAERDRRLAVAEERTRIARDLHDSAGHALNVILGQSGAARLLAEK